ncbi:MAG TPA: hypothetical protein PLJ21_04910 [Pseudobdellovibrionaceae bacterium]|nr:hypothetical protein [Pseudobdellovibrionaceae bacterium]
MQVLNFLTAFITPLEKCKIPYFVTGSIATIFYGEPRLTHDIDIVIHLSPLDSSKFLLSFPLEQYYCPPEEVLQIEIKRRPFGHFNLIHHESGLKADIYPDAEDSFHKWAFTYRKRIDLGNNLELWLAPPEYVIVRKLEFYREGRSEKHLEDIKKMLFQVKDNLDLIFLEKEIHDRGLKVYWESLHCI